MKLLTFLGMGNYELTCYQWKGLEFTSRFAPAAACSFLGPSQLTVFLTEEAHQAHYEEMVRDIPGDITITPVSVAHGCNEQELWQIFNQVAAAVQPGEQVAFDITHGFRSFPFIGLLSAAFLQSGLGVDIQAVLYGAYEVRNKNATPSETPMFDLSPLLSLLQWTTAAGRFNHNGDSRLLAELLRSQRSAMAKAAEGDPDARNQVGRVGNLAGAFESISQSLQLVRPDDVNSQTFKLAETIEKAQPGFQGRTELSPLSLLLDQVRQTYVPLGRQAEGDGDPIPSILESQKELINWYLQHEWWVQAVLLSREWLVNWFINWTDSSEDLLEEKLRDEVENRLNVARLSLQKQQKVEDLFSKGYGKTILDLWASTTSMRNDIAHAGMRYSPVPASNMINKIQKIVTAINTLPIREHV